MANEVVTAADQLPEGAKLPTVKELNAEGEAECGCDSAETELRGKNTRTNEVADIMYERYTAVE